MINKDFDALEYLKEFKTNTYCNDKARDFVNTLYENIEYGYIKVPHIKGTKVKVGMKAVGDDGVVWDVIGFQPGAHSIVAINLYDKSDIKALKPEWLDLVKPCKSKDGYELYEDQQAFTLEGNVYVPFRIKSLSILGDAVALPDGLRIECDKVYAFPDYKRIAYDIDLTIAPEKFIALYNINKYGYYDGMQPQQMVITYMMDLQHFHDRNLSEVLLSKDV